MHVVIAALLLWPGNGWTRSWHIDQQSIERQVCPTHEVPVDVIWATATSRLMPSPIWQDVVMVFAARMAVPYGTEACKLAYCITLGPYSWCRLNWDNWCRKTGSMAW